MEVECGCSVKNQSTDLRTTVGITRSDRIQNEGVYEGFGIAETAPEVNVEWPSGWKGML